MTCVLLSIVVFGASIETQWTRHENDNNEKQKEPEELHAHYPVRQLMTDREIWHLEQSSSKAVTS